MTDAACSASESMAQQVRRHVVQMTSRGASSHVSSCLSVVDILAVLYSDILRVDPAQPDRADRDRFLLSKGHAAAALYATLAASGFFDVTKLDSYYQDGSDLSGHVSHVDNPGVEFSTGSLGHGLGVAAGMALTALRTGQTWRTYALLSDGEFDEGSTWEALLFASHHKLENLVAIIDYNKLQSLGSVASTLALEPLVDKFAAFGWATTEVDGHDHAALRGAFQGMPHVVAQPTMIVCHTTKGKGVSFMEDSVMWHYRSPQGAEYDAAMAELG